MREPDATAFLSETLSGLGVDVLPPSAEGEHWDLLLATPAGEEILVDVKRLSTVTSETVTGLSGRERKVPNQRHLRFLVADRITADARRRLTELGWGWLDLRGHLYLSVPGLLLNTEVEAVWQRPERSDPLAGKAGLEVACLLLSTPDQSTSVRAIARRVGRSSSTVSEIMRGLREEGFIEGVREVQYRDLFWLVVDKWPSRRVPLAKEPALGALESGRGSLDEALGLGMADPTRSVGWALTDTIAAAVYGAPVAARLDHPPDFFVPSETALRRARTLLGVAPDEAEARATVRVAPVPDVCSRRVDPADWSNEHRPLAAPLFVALDLAQDPGRGREILDAWNPANDRAIAQPDDLPLWGWGRVW